MTAPGVHMSGSTGGNCPRLSRCLLPASRSDIDSIENELKSTVTRKSGFKEGKHT
jgi:hypothetical protein